MLNLFFFTFLLFCIGIYGILNAQGDIIRIFLSIEIMFLSIMLNFLFVSLILNDILGEIIVLLILVVSAAELAIGLSILLNIYRLKKTIKISNFSILAH